MDAFLIMLRNIIMFVALALPGYILVKSKLLKEESSGVLSKFLMYVGMPFLILSSTVNNLKISRELLRDIIIAAVIGIAFTFIMFFVSSPLTKMKKEEKARGMMRFCSVFSNNGFLGIPLAMAVVGADSPILTILILINIITNTLMYTLGIYLVSGDKKQISLKKAFLNPVLLAFIAGILLNILNIKAYVPEVSTYLSHFSAIVTPVSMTILGMKLGCVKFSSLFLRIETYYVSLLKLIVFPVVIIGALFALRHFAPNTVDGNMMLGCFFAFSMPTAGLASTFADGFNGDTENAVSFTLGTTLLSVVTIPVLYFLLHLFL